MPIKTPVLYLALRFRSGPLSTSHYVRSIRRDSLVSSEILMRTFGRGIHAGSRLQLGRVADASRGPSSVAPRSRPRTTAHRLLSRTGCAADDLPIPTPGTPERVHRCSPGRRHAPGPWA